MKKLVTSLTLSLLSVAFLATGCSSMKSATSKEQSADELSKTGPSILHVRTAPEKAELDQSFNAPQPVEIYAEVKDFRAPVNDVRVRFVSIPLELKMKHLSGSTWQAIIPADKLKQLGIGNQTTAYKFNVVARAENGEMATSKEPMTLAVKGPDLAKKAG